MPSKSSFMRLVVLVFLVAYAPSKGFLFPQPTGQQSALHVVSQDPSTGEKRFMVLNATEDAILRDKGDAEAALMKNNAGPLLPMMISKKTAKKRPSTAMGFGAKAPKKHKKTKRATDEERENNGSADKHIFASVADYAEALHKDGIVRIDNVLPNTLADSLKEYLVDLRDRSRLAVEQKGFDSQERFADVLLNQNRCDLKVPLGPKPVQEALQHLLATDSTPLRTLIETVFDSYGDAGGGSTATLYELNCFMSQSGARRQLVHSDNVCVEPGVLQEDEPIMLTVFVALQDVDLTMGPTTWILGTHNRAAHNDFYGHDTAKQALLRSRRKAIGTLPRGACAVFDPRTLHCAGANTCEDPEATRALFYISFKNPRVDYPGCPSCSGYGIVDAELTLQELCQGLDTQRQGDLSRRLDFLSSFP